MPLFNGVSAESIPEFSPLSSLEISPKHITKGRKGLESARRALENAPPETFVQETLYIPEPAVTEPPIVPREVMANALATARRTLAQSSRTPLASTGRSDQDGSLVAAARQRAKYEAKSPLVQPERAAPTRGVTDSRDLSDGIRLLAVFLTSEIFEEDRKALRALAHRD